MARKIIPVPGEGLQFISETTGIVQIKESVDTYNDLPVTGNSENDLRITRDTDRMYTWSIAASSGSLSDWLDIGQSLSLDWSAITGGPSSTPAEIDQAVTDSHTHSNKALLDTYDQTNVDLEDAVDKKHTQNTDTGTNSNTFAIDTDISGSDPIKIKNESGVLSARNNADDGYINVRGKSPVDDQDFVTKGWADSNFVSTAKTQKNSDNIIINAFRIAVNGALSIFNMIDGIVDEYEDETGIDTTASLNEVYNSVDKYYKPEGGNRTISVVGNTELDTAQKKFGTASGLFDGSNSALSVDTEKDDFNFGSNDWTIDCWYRLASDPADTDILFKVSGSSTNEFEIVHYVSGGTHYLNVIIESTNHIVTWGSPSVDTWYHMAFVRSGTSGYIFVDGSQVGATQDYTGMSIESNTSVLIGQASANTIDGWLDEFRVSDNARWTSNFTAPSSEYSTDSNTLLLLHMNGTDGSTNFVDSSESVSPANMTLISEDFTAEAEPDSGRIVILEEDIDSVTLNTDLKAYASRDGGSTWAQITLSDEGDFDGDKRILVGSSDFTVSGIGSGTTMKYKIETANEKELRIHATGLSWD